MTYRSIFTLDQDHHFMGEALQQAQIGKLLGEVPIGAVVVNQQGNIISSACNMVELQKTQTAHAEMLALKMATRTINDWRLDGHWLYVTLEPCSMCMGALKLSRLAGIVYGATSPIFGYRLDKSNPFQVYQNDTSVIVSGVRAHESKMLLKSFFHDKRNRVSTAKETNLDAIRQELQTRKVTLEEELKQLSQEKVTDAQVQDPGDQALASTMETLISSFQNTTRAEYERIIQAIAKIDDGTYGTCIDCSQIISMKRLQSNPNAARCLACQELFEESDF